ncbi:hypothetical protein [Massilia sp. NR 4-1]|uniref:hypothetical protein n=1 Tax=Massilia sp. NR 4-1 TaxID=1678028 RepID=UPI00067BB16C|nr:hypothetical protein [Massilia sp. NR 4-1]AKU21898.1 hypothetical protein ACZ75_10880 [Massilia sp. NR 4-1]
MKEVSNTSTTNVRLVRFKPSPLPKVLTLELLTKIEAVNRHIRWLRQHEIKLVSLDLTGSKPTIEVPAEAAPLLTAAAHGLNIKREASGRRVASVTLDDCILLWPFDEYGRIPD